MSVQSVMTALADSIRAKSGATGPLSLEAMKEAVDTIPVLDKITITDAGYLFSGQISEDAYSIFRVVEPIAMNHMYYLNDAIVDVDMTRLDFVPNPAAIALNNMFYNCVDILSVRLPANCKAKTLMSMFQGCKSLTSIDLNGIDTTECTDFRSFINGCVAITEFDGAMMPNMSVANNNCQNFFYNTAKLRKIWLPKEWCFPNTIVKYSPFISNGGSNKMNTNLHIFTDAVSEAAQIANGNWSNVSMVYSSAADHIPESQIHYGATHSEYESYI